MIQVKPFPASDERFAARVRVALGRIAPVSSTGDEIEAPSEDVLRRALSDIRRDYPDIWIRRQDPMATRDRRSATWYAFRDDTLGAGIPRRLR